MVTFVDAFCGIGGFHQAMKDSGIPSECVAAIEVNPDSRRVYRTNFAPALFYGDIRRVAPDQLPDHDVLLGGFPCQPFSQAGHGFTKHRGVVSRGDARADLFGYLVGILRDKQPPYFLFENVPGILRIKDHRGVLVVDSIRKEIGEVGYRLDIVTLNAKDFGIPQNRERVFFVGQRLDIAKPFVAPDPVGGEVAVKDILETNVSRRNSVEYAWRRRRTKRGGKRLTAIRANKVEGYKKGALSLVADLKGEIPSGLSRSTDKVFSCEGIAPCLTTMFHPAFDTGDGWRLLTPREFARLQGFPDTFRIHPNPTTAKKQFGNSVAVPVVASLIRSLLGEADKPHRVADPTTKAEAFKMAERTARIYPHLSVSQRADQIVKLFGIVDD